MADVNVGTGTEIRFLSTGFSARLVAMEWNMTSGSIATSSLSSITKETFVSQSLSSPGIIKAELHFSPDAVAPVDDPSEVLQITFPPQTIWSGSGFVTEYENDGMLEGLMVARVTIQTSGIVTVTVFQSGGLINDDGDLVSNDEGATVYAA